MIRSLHIEHYALIDHLDIEFQNGFSVITGETGAGKSIILGALGLLRGQRADIRAIQAGEQRCMVEAEFDVADSELELFFQDNELDFDGRQCIVRRELTATGKSRAFVNDTPVALNLLKLLADRLVDIHSQHQNLLLGRQDFQLSVLDIVAQNRVLLAEYSELYYRFRQAEEQLQEAREALQHNRDDEDYLRFQYQQLDEAQLQPDEQDLLEQEAELLEHAEDIRLSLAQACQALDSSDDDSGPADVLQRLRSARDFLNAVAGRYPQAGELAQRIESCYIELKDIAADLDSQAENIEVNPQRLAAVQERLNLIYSLQKKHHVNSVDELMALYDALGEKLQLLDGSDERVGQLERLCGQLRGEVLQAAQQISSRRCQAATQVERQMERSLQPLGMPHVQLRIVVDSSEKHLSASGVDHVSILFSANKNGQLRDIADIASGGETARVMLCLKSLIASAVQLPTIIFDEIDTGVSGSIAEQMAHIMQQMGAEGRQVISITHLPQIAALGSQHYLVYKQEQSERTTTHIRLLNDDERITELAHMLSGAKLTPEAIENAKVLLGTL